MALVTEETVIHLSKARASLLGDVEWNRLHMPGDSALASGIYRCEGCGDETISLRGAHLPLPDEHKHRDARKVQWRLIVKAEAKF